MKYNAEPVERNKMKEKGTRLPYSLMGTSYTRYKIFSVAGMAFVRPSQFRKKFRVCAPKESGAGARHNWYFV